MKNNDIEELIKLIQKVDELNVFASEDLEYYILVLESELEENNSKIALHKNLQEKLYELQEQTKEEAMNHLMSKTSKSIH